MKIEYYTASENNMFSPGITAMIRFARTPEAVKCAMCGKEGREFWTMIVPFTGHYFHEYTTVESEELPALTLVCEDHMMAPSFIKLAEETLNNGGADEKETA